MAPLSGVTRLVCVWHGRGGGILGGDVGAQRLLEGGQGSPRPGKRSVQGRVPPSSQPQFPHLQLRPADPLVNAEEVCACLGTAALSLASSQGLELSPNRSSLKLLFILQSLVALPRLHGNCHPTPQ